MRFCVSLLVTVIFVLIQGCTGTAYLPAQGPPSGSLIRTSPLFERAAVYFSTETDPVAIDVFTQALISRRIAQHVMQVSNDKVTDRPLLLVDLRLSLDHHPTARMIKNYFLGFTLFLLEPILWYDIDYSVQGSLRVLDTKGLLGPFDAQAHSTTRARWLSLGELSNLNANAQRETLTHAADQLIGQIKQQIKH